MERQLITTYYFACAVLAGLAELPLTILLDGTTAGRGCMVLMASVVYRGRAIPLLWSVVKAKKGHLSQDVHCPLIGQLREVIPAQAKVLLFGDGEFDGILLQAGPSTVSREVGAAVPCSSRSCAVFLGLEIR